MVQDMHREAVWRAASQASSV